MNNQQGGGGFGGGFGGFDPFDFFNFGGRGEGGEEREPEKKQGAPFLVNLKVSLEDIFSGTDLRVILTRPTLCHSCKGTGAESEDDVHTCPKCRGHGVYMKTVQVGPGFI